MALNTTIIKTRLASVPWGQKDDEARNIIMKGATSMELKSLDAEGVLRLYEALALLYPRYYSADDRAAMERLGKDTQFQPVTKTPDFGVDLIKKARPSQPTIQSQLTPGLVTRIYAAENKRLSWYERIGFDGSSIGRGQLTQLAYTEVKKPKHFKTALETCLTQVYLPRMLGIYAVDEDGRRFDMKTYKVNIPAHYAQILLSRPLEDFVVAAYLAVRIINATKAGRSPKDAARFAVALYHGMRKMVRTAQIAASDDINWTPVEAELLKQGFTDEVAYVNEVVK
ncbi:MAG: hypothetical protein V3T84_00680 [Phycisphaerales bacterium]